MQIWMQKDIHIIFSEKCKLQRNTHGIYLIDLFFKYAFAKIQTKIFNMYKPKLLTVGIKSEIKEFYFLLVCTL